MVNFVYIELHTASAFSFLRGASLPETLAERAAALEYPAMALVDRDGLYGIPRFHKAAQAVGVRAIVGVELTIDDCRLTNDGANSTDSAAQPAQFRNRQSSVTNRQWNLPVLVSSRTGYQNLSRLLTRMKLRAPKGEGALTLEDLDGHVEGLVALPGQPLLNVRQHGVGGLLDRLVGTFGRTGVYVAIARHLDRAQEIDNESLVDLAAAYRVPIIATGGVRFASPDERPLHDVFTCLHHKTTLAQAGRRLVANAERYLRSPEAMAARFADLPQAVTATRELADRLEYTMADLGYRFPEYPVPSGETMASFLRKITEVGARDRYRPYHDRARAQVGRELDLIEKLDLAGYFLIVWDLINFCRQRGILVQGRGSAANSAVCYSLGITAVDPVGMELLFERFLSEERGEWPDIDLDLPSGDRRERVIQYVYERYGQLGAAMTANVITYRNRSATREVGKALGFDPDLIDRLARLMHRFEFVDSSETLARHLREVGVDSVDPRMRQFADLWHRMQDLPRHLGQHSGGMVICQDRLDQVVPLENASMPGRVVVQWDKEDCADMGLIKVDLLGLGMMSVLQDALVLINTTSASGALGCSQVLSGAEGASGALDLAHLPPDDPVVYRMLQEADTIGLFQVESRAQMATLPRLKPACFYDIVVQVAIIRPGPIVGQMVHPYLNRRAGREPVTYAHPSLEPILRRTLGVPLFQEQLLRMAMAAAGFTGGQAEELRRAMGFKRSEKRMRVIEQQLRAGMATQGITGEAAEQIITSIASFALYGFPESHAASFAHIAYASAYLKAHYPAVFYTALLNNQPMGFYHPATLVKDAQRHGVHFAPVDVEASAWDCTIGSDGRVRLGLRYVAGLREQVGRAIAATVVRPPSPPARCPKCGCDDRTMLEIASHAAPSTQHPAPHLARGTQHAALWECFCNLCAHDWTEPPTPARKFASPEDLIRKTGARRDELTVLAEIGALAAFGYDRRAALWQIEKAVRPEGELFELQIDDCKLQMTEQGNAQALDRSAQSPLHPMQPIERMAADFAGTGLTIGPHPMSFHRPALALKGVLRAVDLPRQRPGRRVRVAGCVITRQRPGTAKGFVFLTLEDETGISNVIVRPKVYDEQRLSIIESSFVIVDGLLQHQDGVTAVQAERVLPLEGVPLDVESHDFR
ncbi:MAG: error-prone DNA polymerase [Vicinamibacteria bacterium]|nr:error-prone DNA polymerase [Vicinamibacteria bacterium]